MDYEKPLIEEINDSTFVVPTDAEHLEIVVGDELQSDFYPRVKLKAWDNEANLSVGCISDGLSTEQVTASSDFITWDTVDSDNITGADTDFVLTANIADLTNYKSGSIITCRVYQLSV